MKKVVEDCSITIGKKHFCHCVESIKNLRVYITLYM